MFDCFGGVIGVGAAQKGKVAPHLVKQVCAQR